MVAEYLAKNGILNETISPGLKKVRLCEWKRFSKVLTYLRISGDKIWACLEIAQENIV